VKEKRVPEENYDVAYSQPDWFGARESHLLERYAAQIPDQARVLDIGIGQGRNALPLARRGCRVTGIDPSPAAVEQVNARASRENLPLQAFKMGFEDFDPQEPFDAVLCFGLLQMLPPDRAASLVDRLRRWTRSGGSLFLIAWHVDDPGFANYCENWERTGLRSFRSPDGDRFRTFLGPREVLQFFRGWHVIHHWEGLGPQHRHGENPPERHGEVEVVLSRP
jgi:SAM-dependent methyltransferase